MFDLADSPFARYRPLVGEWDAFADAALRPLPTCVWANPLRTDAGELAAWLRWSGWEPEPVGWYPGAFRLDPDVGAGAGLGYVAGLYHVQEEVSLLPPVLLDARPGERVLDLCAAPGGKTAQIAAAMRNRGTVVANDRSRGRLHVVRTTAARMGLANITTTNHDAARFPGPDGVWDRVLADVPCTCEGTSRKHPRVVGRARVEDACRKAETQEAILRRAVALCRPGGRIVYSTCTYAPEENEGVVDAVLRDSGGALRVVEVHVPGLETAPGIVEWDGRTFDPSLRRALRVWPETNDTGGFFTAVLEKADGPAPAVTDDAFPAPEAAERAPWLALFGDRFGIPASAFDGFVFTRPSHKYVALVARDHRPPAGTDPSETGIPLVRTTIRYPKPTTAAAQLFGRYAVRNAVRLDDRQASAFAQRETFGLTPAQTAACTDYGYVLVAARGVWLGVSFYREEDGTVRSLFPKMLMR